MHLSQMIAHPVELAVPRKGWRRLFGKREVVFTGVVTSVECGSWRSSYDPIRVTLEEDESWRRRYQVRANAQPVRVAGRNAGDDTERCDPSK